MGLQDLQVQVVLVEHLVHLVFQDLQDLQDQVVLPVQGHPDLQVLQVLLLVVYLVV